MNLTTFCYHFYHGPNTGAVIRAYKWLEIFALKIVDLVVPHRRIIICPSLPGLAPPACGRGRIAPG